MKTTPKSFLVWGASLLGLGTFASLAGTILGMSNAFDTLGSTSVGEPSKLSDDISIVLYSNALGLAIIFVGLALMLTSLFLWRKTRPAKVR